MSRSLIMRRTTRRRNRSALAVAVAGVAAAAVSSLAGASGVVSENGPPARVRTIATIPRPVYGFARNGRYLAWLRSSCSVVIQDLRSGARTRVARGDCPQGGPDGLVLAGDRAYWTVWQYLDDYHVRGLTHYWADLLSASVHDPVTRELAFQRARTPFSIVQPQSDGRRVYFPSSKPDTDLQPVSLLRRFTGRHSKRLTGVIEDMHLLAAARGRYAFARLLTADDCAREPAWSPDGRRIAFARAPSSFLWAWWWCPGGVWVMNADGTDAERIAPKGRNPDWSPDGTTLAYDVSGRIVIADANGDNGRTVIKNGVNPAWSPDGNEIAFEREQMIVVARADGTGERVVAVGRAPDWSPDGSQLVFSGPRGLTILDADASYSRSLTSGSNPAWSPDGRWIAFWDCSESFCAVNGTELTIIAPDGSGRREVPGHREYRVDVGAAWSPDSNDLVFARESAVAGESHIFKLSTGATPLTSAPPTRTPIEVRASDGRRLAELEPQGIAVALAVTRAVTAAIVSEGTAWHVEIFSPQRRTVEVPQTRPTQLAASGTRLVLGSGRSIFALDAGTGRLRRIAVAGGTPIGLSVTGRTITWAERHPGVIRIRAVEDHG